MKGILIREHGGVEQLALTDIDEPQRGEWATVRVRAVALNHLDLWVRRGVPGHRFPLPLVPGSEVSGTIERLPAAGEGWSLGDEVIVAPGISCGSCSACLSGNDPLCPGFGILGESEHGGCAEKISVPVRNLFRKPPSLSFAEAAAVPLDFMTAWHMLIARAQLRKGETVLVQAGASGVGSAAIQIARLWGASVIATAGSPAKLDLSQRLGAEETIAYTTTDFLSEVRKITGGKGVDVVVDHVGAETFERSLRALARGGRLVTCGATAGADVHLNLRLVFFKLLSILGSTMGSLSELRAIMGHVESGALYPVVDRVLPLAEAGAAHLLLERRAVLGKIVLEV